MTDSLIDKIVGDVIGRNNLAAMGQIDSVEGVNPEVAAENVRISRKYGHPGPVSDEVFSELKSRERSETIAQIVRSHPNVRAFYSDPANAAVGHDDYEALADLEYLVGKQAYRGSDPTKTVGSVPTSGDEPVYAGPIAEKRGPQKGLVERAIFGNDGVLATLTENKYAQSAAAGAALAAGTTVAGTGDTLDILANFNDWVTRSTAFSFTGEDVSGAGQSREFIKPVTAVLQEYGEGIKSDTKAVDVPVDERDFGTDVAGAVGQIGAQALTALWSAPAGLTSMFAQGVNSQKDKLVKEGVDLEGADAQAGMILGGLTTMVTEAIGLKSVTKLLPQAAQKRLQGVLAQAIQSGGVEAVTEAVEGILQNLIAYSLADVDEGFIDYVTDGALYEGAVAGTAGGGINLMLNLLVPGRARVNIERGAEQQKQYLNDLHAASEVSNLKNRAPEQFADFVKEAQGKDTDNVVYAPAEQFNELYQSADQSPADFADLMGIPTEYDQSQAVGHDIAIPLEKYLAHTDAETHAKIVDHLKVEPDGFSIKDIENGVAEDSVTALSKHLERKAVQEDPNEWVAEQARDAMVDAGIPHSEAEHLGAQFGAMVTTMAERSGMRPSEYLRALGGMPEFRMGGRRDEVGEGEYQQARRRSYSPRDMKSFLTYARKNPTAESSMDLGHVPHGLSEAISDLSGGDFSKYTFRIFPDGVGHEDLRHTDEKIEASRGQTAVRDEHYNDLVETLTDPDSVAYLGVSKTNTEEIAFVRNLGDYSVTAITERRKKRRSIALKSFWITPSRENVPPLTESLSLNTRSDDRFAQKPKIVTREEIVKEYGSEFDQKAAVDNSPRGSIQFPENFGDRPPIISLFEGRDLSTTLHELGHYYLEVLRFSAQLEGATPELQKMWADTKEFLGIGDDNVISREAHEKWAETSEIYMGSGKAPSAELQTAFERFRGWMLQVWSYVRRTSGEEVDQRIDPKIRDVLDRMLATDQQISEARVTAETMKAFTDPETAGMNEKEWAAYHAQDQAAVAEAEKLAQQRVADEYRDRQGKEHIAAMKEARNQAEAIVSEQPVYKVLDALTRKPTSDMTDWQLDREAVVKMGFGKHLRSKENTEAGNRLFPVSQRGIYAPKGKEGAHPDVVAGAFGFESGRGMLNDILDAPPKEEAVEALAQKIYKDQHGDTLTDGSIADAVYEGLHADEKAKFLETELKALYRKAPVRNSEPQAPSRQEVREIARQQIAKLPIQSALKSRIYLNAERRHARDAYRHVANGEFSKARAAKLQQMLNFFMWKESVALDKTHDANMKRVTKVNRDEASSSQSMDIDFIKAAKLILFRHGLAKEPEGYSFHDWFMDLQAEDPTTSSMLGRAVAIANGDSKPWQRMTVTEYKAMFDAVASLLHIGRARREVEINGEKRDIDDTRNMFIAQMREHYGDESRAISANGVSRWVMSMTASLRRVTSWARMVDGGDDGPIQSLMVRPVYDAIEQYREKKKDIIQRVLDVLEPRLGDMYEAGAIEAPELNFTFKTKGELFVAILNTGTESNMETLLEGRGWGEDQWSGFINRMVNEGVLTNADFDAAQQVWDIFESLRRPANIAHRKMYGHYFDKIPRRSFTIGGTKYRGGYVPLVYDKDASSMGQTVDVNQILSEQQSGAMFPSTGRGFTKARTGATAPVALDLHMVPGHVDKVLRFTYLQAPIRTIGRVISGHDFKESLHHVDPHLLKNMIVPWLQRTASQQVETRSPDSSLGWLDGPLRMGRRVAGGTIMVGNVVNALQTFTGFFPAMTRVGPASLMRGMASYYFAPRQTREFVFSRSQFMEDRVTVEAHETMRELGELLAEPNKLISVQNFILKHGYVLQRITDRLVTVPVWVAAYNEAVEQGVNEKEATRRADNVVRDTQSSFAAEDVSAIEAGGSVKRTFMMFASYFNTMLNLGLTERTMMHPAAVAALVVVLPATMAEVIGAALRGGFDDEDEDGYLDDAALFIINSNVRYLLAMVPGLGNAGNAIWGAFDDKSYNDKVSLTPVVAVPEKITKSIIGAKRSVENGEVDARAVRDTLSAVMMLLGGGGNAVGKAGGYAYGVATGEYDPEHAGDVIQGVMSGRQKD